MRIALSRSLRWRFPITIAVILFCPLTVFFVQGIVGWCRGDGVMRGRGLQRYYNASIDPQTRLPWATSGCLVDGTEWIWQGPYNAAIRIMTLLFGPASGAYDGPIPSREEARAALAHAEPIDWQELARDRVTLDGAAPVRLGRLVGPALIHSCYAFDPLRRRPGEEAPGSGTIRATLFQERVLLIELRDEFFHEEDTGQIAAIDIRRGLPFRYFAGARMSCRGLPLLWRPVGPRALDMDLAATWLR